MESAGLKSVTRVTVCTCLPFFLSHTLWFITIASLSYPPRDLSFLPHILRQEIIDLRGCVGEYHLVNGLIENQFAKSGNIMREVLEFFEYYSKVNEEWYKLRNNWWSFQGKIVLGSVKVLFQSIIQTIIHQL